MITTMTGTPDTHLHDSLTYKQTLSCLSMVINKALHNEKLQVDQYRVNQVVNAISYIYEVSPHLNWGEILQNWMRPTPTDIALMFDSKSRVVAITKDLTILVGNIVGSDVYLDYLSPYYSGLKLKFDLRTEILLLKVIS